jgi:hypothetical protein
MKIVSLLYDRRPEGKGIQRKVGRAIHTRRLSPFTSPSIPARSKATDAKHNQLPSGLTGRIRGITLSGECVLADKRLARDGGQVDALLRMLLVTMYASEKSAISVDAAARDLWSHRSRQHLRRRPIQPARLLGGRPGLRHAARDKSTKYIENAANTAMYKLDVWRERANVCLNNGTQYPGTRTQIRNTKTTAKLATADLHTLLERIAQQHLSIETLATRHRAALDPWVAGENAPAGVPDAVE